MYYIDPHEIISSLVTPLMDASKRAREYIVEISLNDAPVPVVRRLSVPSNLYVGHSVIASLIGNPLTALSKTSSSVLGGNEIVLFSPWERHLQ